MKITFICSGAEPGKDGVGDYTRTLAGHVERFGTQTQIIALNDVLAPEEHDASALRLSTNVPWNRRTQLAAAAVQEFDPDIVSVQFVPYGFHRKGFCSDAIRSLVEIIGNRRSHVMMHELWIGDAVEYGWRQRLLGAAQKRIVLDFLRIKPAIVHTSNPVYRMLLERNGVAASVLPIFGNIPVDPNADPDWLFQKMREAGQPMYGINRSKFLLAGLFGTIHPQWSPDDFVRTIDAVLPEKKLVLASIGRASEPGRQMLLRACKRLGVPCVELGWQSAKCASSFLQTVDLGIATSPWALIGKSGAAAAMRDHGLPVVVTRDGWKLRNGTTPEPMHDPLLFKLDARFSAHLRDGVQQGVPALNAARIAAEFLQGVKNVTSGKLEAAA